MIKVGKKRGTPSTSIGKERGQFVGVDLNQDPVIGFSGKAGKMAIWKKKKGGKK